VRNSIHNMQSTLCATVCLSVFVYPSVYHTGGSGKIGLCYDHAIFIVQ